MLAIGGFKEKVLAAHRAGLKTVIVPEENRRDMVEIPRKARRDLEFLFVRRVEEVLEAALLTSEIGRDDGDGQGVD